jgi:ATP-binding cassette subfamily F protein uup
MRLLMTEPNVLLLDEPTNDLDIDTLTALEDLLDGWPGVLVAVSHDRYFLERVTDRTVALLGDGKLPELPGGIDEYLDRRRVAVEDAAVGSGAARRRSGDTRAARKELARLERALERLGRREAALQDDIAAHAADYLAIAAYDEELRAVRAERAETEEAWLVLAEEIESGS